MLTRITFALVAGPRASYKFDELEHAKVGIFTDFGPMPSEVQLSSILLPTGYCQPRCATQRTDEQIAPGSVEGIWGKIRGNGETGCWMGAYTIP